MKSSFRKRISLLLTLLSVSSTVAACGGDTPATDDTTASGGNDTTASTEAEDPRLSIDDGLPDVDLKDYKFRILPCYPSGMGAVSLYAPETDTGDVVDSAAYKRNQIIEERFNCEIVLVDDGAGRNYSDQANYVKTLIMAGEDDFDISLNHCIFGMGPVIEGLYTNVADMKYQDFTKPWYSENTLANNLINGKMYYVSDIVGLEAIRFAEVMYINRDMFADNKLELPYNDVFAGTWTFDKMNSLVKSVYKDLNGNSEKDGSDAYGYAAIANQNAWITNLGVETVEISSDGTLKDVANSDKMITLVEKMYGFFFNNDGTFLTDGTDPVTGAKGNAWMTNIFTDGRAMIITSVLDIASGELRKSDIEYGIIPYPKLDENQENYITTAYTGSFIGVPITVQNPDNTSLILEALLAESYKIVVPVYMETALKDKYTSDEESRKCLDIIYDSLTVPFGSIYMEFTGYNATIGTLMKPENPSTDFASFYAERKATVDARLAKVQEFFQSDN